MSRAAERGDHKGVCDLSQLSGWEQPGSGSIATAMFDLGHSNVAGLICTKSQSVRQVSTHVDLIA
jgi:hypothetical protein